METKTLERNGKLYKTVELGELENIGDFKGMLKGELSGDGKKWRVFKEVYAGYGGALRAKADAMVTQKNAAKVRQVKERGEFRSKIARLKSEARKSLTIEAATKVQEALEEYEKLCDRHEEELKAFHV